MKLQPEHILTFVALVRSGSVGGAAEARHLTQPAASNQLRQLQQAVGEDLYRRAGRGVALTAAGEAFYAHALAVEQALRAAEAFADGLHGGDTGRVHVAASQTIAGSLLPAFLADFQQHHAGIEVHVDTSNSRQVVGNLNGYDIGLVESPLAHDLPPDFRAVPLGLDEVVLVMPRAHALAGLDAVPLQMLQDQPLIWREAGSGTSEVVEQAFRQAGIMPSRRISLGGVAAVLEAVRQGLGLGFASHLTLKRADAMLVARPLAPRLLRPLTMLVSAHPTRAARILADDLRAKLGSLPQA
jgi:LysR family transcriptional regulator, low CO2-responsive transcriptional regulator